MSLIIAAGVLRITKFMIDYMLAQVYAWCPRKLGKLQWTALLLNHYAFKKTPSEDTLELIFKRKEGAVDRAREMQEAVYVAEAKHQSFIQPAGFDSESELEFGQARRRPLFCDKLWCN